MTTVFTVILNIRWAECGTFMCLLSVLTGECRGTVPEVRWLSGASYHVYVTTM